MKKVLILASDRAELASFPNSFITRSTGVGLEAAAIIASEAIVKEKPELVINIGSAGAKSTVAKIGEIVRIKEVYNLDYDLTSYRLPKYSTLDENRATVTSLSLQADGLILGSSNKFATRAVDNIDIYDMEGYGVALAARHFGLPCAIFKGISDIVGSAPALSDYRQLLKQLRLELAEAVLAFIEG